MSVTKYRRSLVGRKLEGAQALGCFRLGWTNEIEKEQFNEVEQEQLQTSYFSELMANSLETDVVDYIIDTPPR